MALPFINGAKKKRDQILSIDLGGRTTKAVHIQRQGDRLALAGFALLDAPIYEKNLSVELLSEHLKTVVQAFEGKPRFISLAVGVSDAVVRHAELPAMPVGDMRLALKNNPRSFLQQDLPGHVFDCHIMLRPPGQKTPEKAKSAISTPKQTVLVAGARKQLLDDLQVAVRGTGLLADHVLPGVLGPVNAFELSQPEVFSKEILALVDIGFKNTSICILEEGQLILSRVVAIGGDKLTNGLAEVLSISYAEAEGIKVGMPAEVQAQLESLVVPLARELRASIDFYEHQHDKAVSQVFVTGGSARSEFVMQVLQAELTVECKVWNPVSFLEQALPPEQLAELDSVAPQLAVAVGAAVATL